MDLVVLFPGQGSQKPGMGKDLAAAHPAARQAFQRVDMALGDSLSTLCFEGPADTLTLTHNAQPALLAHGAAVWSVIGPTLAAKVRAAAGHSLGEFTAWHAVGALGLEDAARLVRRRGEVMHEAAVARPGTMAAILGETSEPIEAICERASGDPEGGLVVPANFNCPGQLVISGEMAGVQKAMALARTAGAKRAIQLNVGGAFHSPLMAPARAGLSAALDRVTFAPPSAPVCVNVNAEFVTEPSEAKRLLVQQLTAAVRWTDVLTRLAAAHPNALFVEMGPGSVLLGLVKKVAPQVLAMTCGTAVEVERLMSKAA
ncbi:MAG: ACP S-malonyltransferase [Gemmatimonadaceae bacterium]